MDLLEVRDVSVTFSGLKALSHVSFGVAAGEICAVIGPNGAGKSTLFNAITGYVPCTEGQVAFNGRALGNMGPQRISALGVRRTFQNGGAFRAMTVLENVLTGLSQLTNNTLLGVVFGLSAARRKDRAMLDRAVQLIDSMGLMPLAHRVAADLSSGQQRLVEITRALATSPKLLMLDEPAVGLTSTERDHLVQTLQRLSAEGVTIVLVEHTIDLVMAVSSQVVVLDYGTVIAKGTPAEIRTNSSVLEAYLG